MRHIVTKFLSAASTVLAFLTAAQGAYAQVRLCPEGSAQFGPLCTIAGRPEQAFANLVSLIIQLGLILAAIIAVLFLIWGGIRWILSGGDKAGVEAARNTIIAAIIGLVIVFLSFLIITIIGRIFQIDLFQLTIPQLTV